MTLDQIKAIVLQGDPAASHYASTARGNYTVWREYARHPATADDVHLGGWRFQVDRFTKTENDAIAASIETALSDHPGVAYSYMVDFEPETGYIHHIFDCEAV